MIEYKNAPAAIKGKEPIIEAWLNVCVESFDFRLGRVVYQFLTNQEITAANHRFLDHGQPTDIITFNYSKRKRLEVEMLLGFQTIESQASLYKEDTLTEYCRVMVHGLLHCCGFDDKTEEERKEMRRQEDFCLNLRPKKLIIS